MRKPAHMETIAWKQVKRSYEEKEATIGDTKIAIAMEEGAWKWTASRSRLDVIVKGSERLQSRAEELAINAAAWLNAGMPAPEM